MEGAEGLAQGCWRGFFWVASGLQICASSCERGCGSRACLAGGCGRWGGGRVGGMIKCFSFFIRRRLNFFCETKMPCVSPEKAALIPVITILLDCKNRNLRTGALGGLISTAPPT